MKFPIVPVVLGVGAVGALGYILLSSKSASAATPGGGAVPGTAKGFSAASPPAASPGVSSPAMAPNVSPTTAVKQEEASVVSAVKDAGKTIGGWFGVGTGGFRTRTGVRTAGLFSNQSRR